MKEANAVDSMNNEMSLPSANEYPSLRGVFQPKQTSSSSASIAHANWEFVKQLLQVFFLYFDSLSIFVSI